MHTIAKLIILLFFGLGLTQLNAQISTGEFDLESDLEYEPKRELGPGLDISIRIGFNLSKLMIKDDFQNVGEEFTTNPGFHIGPLFKFPLYKNKLGLETGLLFSSKGTDGESTVIQPGLSAFARFNLYYLELPINLNYNLNIKNLHSLNFIFGPYLSYGVVGSRIEIFDTQSRRITEAEKINFGSDPDENIFKPLDFGLNIGIEYQKRPFRIGVFYDLGLLNISTLTDFGSKIKTRNFRISAAFMFRKNK